MVFAVPARRGVFSFRQPDGTTVRVSLTGDESGHYYLAGDGTPMTVGSDGFLRSALAPGQSTADFKKSFAARRSAGRRIHPAVKAAQQRRAQAAKASRADGSLPQQGMGLFTSNYPRTGKIRSLVFLVQYKDVKFKTPNAGAYFSHLFNQEGFSENGGTGSVRDYFLDQSNGLFDITYDVFGPMTLKNNRSYYGENYPDEDGDDRAPEEMAEEAVEFYKSQIDYSRYDYDGDGCIDNIFIVYAGEGEASYGPAESVWPHSWEVPDGKIYNGKQLYGYCCTNEVDYDGSSAPIGTFVHEFSHVMGLPDLYNTDDSDVDYTPGSWSVLDYGPYNNNGRTPAGYGAFERNAMGWLTPRLLDGPESVSLGDMQSANDCCLLQTPVETEFFLLENRQQTGWDKYLPGHGLLVWHIDFNQKVWDSNSVNNVESHQYAEIIEAGARCNNMRDDIMAEYPFPGTTGNTSLKFNTKPAMKTWAGADLGMPITKIKETAGVITFDIAKDISSVKPKAYDAVAASPAAVTFRWDAVEGAVRYILTAGTGTTSTPLDPVTNAFGKPMDGWSCPTDRYTSTGFIGNASPSLKFGKTGDKLETPVYDSPIAALSFWTRGAQCNAANTVAVSGRDTAGNWKEIASYKPSTYNSKGAVVSFDIPDGIYALQMVYNKAGSGNVAVDDMTITFSGAGLDKFADLDGLDVGNVTEYTAAVPADAANVVYYIRAVNADGDSSLESNRAEITFSSGIDGIIATPDAPAVYYNLQGLPVANPIPGQMYIRRQGTTITKVIL